MCGVAGFWSPERQENAGLRAIAAAMVNPLHHRGPDNYGVWTDAAVGMAMGHCRLSIIDVSSTGNQPMVSASGRMVIAYNGEVYNFPDLRRELEADGIIFRGHSDTEVVLQGCEHWGVESTLQRLNGMFAFALWDRMERRLYLVRDRLGIKPLYWAKIGRAVLFASEVRAIKQHPSFHADIDRNALAAFIRHGYLPSSNSIFKDVSKLRPGTVLRFAADVEPVETAFWSLENTIRMGRESRESGFDESEAEERLDGLLREAVGSQMIADVPLGAFLSGGIDSSAVVALMQAQSTRPVKTYSIGFKAAGYDEAVHARRVAQHLGTDHTELYLEPAHALATIPQMPDIYDEPFADPSQIPTYLVSRLARRDVKVSLSGDGGDELFAGYNRYRLTTLIQHWLSLVPHPSLRHAVAKLLRAVPPSSWDGLFRFVPHALKLPQAGDKIHKLANLIKSDSDDLYLQLISLWNDPEEIVIGGYDKTDIFHDPATVDFLSDPVARMQYLDTMTYLPDDILTKVDRASMAVSLEARVPLLDHRVVEFACQLPRHLKTRRKNTKWLLRKVLYRYVPPALVDRPKMGFGVPIDSWLRGPLRDWAESLLSEERLRREGYLEPKPIRKKWVEHLSGSRNWQYPLWAVLMFQAWLERQKA